ncbi:MAG: 16S rRNA (cytosine(1402)-N(4))-methyltransferase RsmH [Gemmatimonadota bacterium]
MGAEYSHEPVLATEVVALLEPGCGTWIDGTLGGGGHAELLLRADPDLVLIGVDRDPDAVAAAARRLDGYTDRVTLVEGNFRDIANIAASGSEAGTVQGALLDLGVSSHQLDLQARGFSFRRSTPLDMRMGGTAGGGRTAADVLNSESEAELGRIFRVFGEERRWRRLAREVVKRRSTAPFQTSDDFVAACTTALGPGLSAGIKARLFQALRIAVNDELGALDEVLPALRDRLDSGGRMAVISYHSLEDRIVKNAFREWSQACVCPPGLPVCRCRGKSLGTTLTRKPIRPSQDETSRNPRSRSARLRGWRRA